MSRMNNTPAELSYFATELRQYLAESHPETKDEEFVTRRADTALGEYCRAVAEGVNRLDAMELARDVLFSGLGFSKIGELRYIVQEWFDEVPEEHIDRFCLKMLKRCYRIFDKYDPGDDFEQTPQHQDMQLELTGVIQYYIERYGI